MKVILCWSGNRSKEIAEALHDWIGVTIQFVEPWMSPDIEKGVRWSAKLAKEFTEAKIGIFCLTRENLNAPWILFEAGAISKTEDARVCTFSLDLKSTDIEQPLAQFQFTKFDEKDIRALAGTINNALEKVGERALPEGTLNKSFELNWPDLEGKLKAIASKETEKVKPVRDEREILEEILLIVRAQASRRPIEESSLLSYERLRKLQPSASSSSYGIQGQSGVQGQKGEPNGGVQIDTSRRHYTP